MVDTKSMSIQRRTKQPSNNKGPAHKSLMTVGSNICLNMASFFFFVILSKQTWLLFFLNHLSLSYLMLPYAWCRMSPVSRFIKRKFIFLELLSLAFILCTLYSFVFVICTKSANSDLNCISKNMYKPIFFFREAYSIFSFVKLGNPFFLMSDLIFPPL